MDVLPRSVQVRVVELPRSSVSRVNSRSGSSSKSSTSMNGSSLEAELSSEFNPKVPCCLIGLDVVVSKFVGSKFRYVG